jgi:hypothetical protein
MEAARSILRLTRKGLTVCHSAVLAQVDFWVRCLLLLGDGRSLS